MRNHKEKFLKALVLLQAITSVLCHTPFELLRERRSVEGGCAKVSPDLLAEIKSYRPTVKKIGEFILNGTYKGMAKRNLTNFVDEFGSRLVGTEALEKAIDHVLWKMGSNGLSNVHPEDVMAPKWVRGHESLMMLAPYKKEIDILGLLPTVQTPLQGITSEVVVVNDFKELENNQVSQKVRGKILVFNHAFDDPVNSARYRHRSAIEGSKVGAVATITRSYTTFSLATPHTGELHYNESNVTPIPAGEISIEDAEVLGRLYAKGHKIVLSLILRNQRLGMITTRNSIGDYLGSSKPNEYVMVSGHVDSWDVGQGALDDGYGVILSLMVPEVLKNLQLRPKRTVRTVVWTAEEIGRTAIGADQYAQRHLNELQNYSFFLEADSGFFDTAGLVLNGTDETACIVAEILKLLEPDIINKTVVSVPFPELKTDIVSLMKASPGVPGAMIASDFDKYFWYHHSKADTASLLNEKDLDVCLALMSSVSYVLADLSIMLPRAVTK